jgi:energy-coupling factor transporter ATP-binding protein EcfA2
MWTSALGPVLGITVPAGSLVVVAGLPGAGKTTLLRRLAASAPPGVVALDSEDVAARLRTLPVAYPVLRPLVHALHLVRVLAALTGPAACVLTTDPMTGPLRRLLLGVAARRTGRSLHLVLVDATVAEAVDGQDRRGRTLGRRRMARHAQRWERLRSRGPAPATSTLPLPRTRAGEVTHLKLSPPPPSVRELMDAAGHPARAGITSFANSSTPLRSYAASEKYTIA